jgi:hypothetical protein
LKPDRPLQMVHPTNTNRAIAFRRQEIWLNDAILLIHDDVFFWLGRLLDA